MKEVTTKFILVRHGETNYNSKLILQGWQDSQLNENGIAQAKAVAEYLKDRKFDAAYSSVSSRAADTAREVLKYHPEIELTLTGDLRECHLGEFEGRYQPDVLKEHPEIINAFRQEELEPIIKDGETRQEFQQRVSGFFAAILPKHPDQTVLISAHGGVMQRIFCMAAGIPSLGNLLPMTANASVSSIVYFHRSGKWQLDTWNYHDHLQGLSIKPALAL